jgi:SRSO17 transposase
MGQQGAPGQTEETQAATGAVDFHRPGCRPTGPSHLSLRRHYGWSIEHAFRLGKQEAGLMDYEGRNYTGLVRHLTLALIVLGFVATHTERLRGEKSTGDGRAGVPGAEPAV